MRMSPENTILSLVLPIKRCGFPKHYPLRGNSGFYASSAGGNSVGSAHGRSAAERLCYVPPTSCAMPMSRRTSPRNLAAATLFFRNDPGRARFLRSRAQPRGDVGLHRSGTLPAVPPPVEAADTSMIRSGLPQTPCRDSLRGGVGRGGGTSRSKASVHICSVLGP